GEAFFTGSNPQGFDFYSAHLFLRNYKEWLKALALGDYSVSFGQGLILQLGYANGKSGFTTDVARLNRTLNPYTSVNEASFFRGGAATLHFFDHLDLTVFGSVRQLDGNVVAEEDLEIDDPVEVNLSSLYNSGLHRTPSEIEDEGAVRNVTTGGSIKYKTDRWHLAANAVYDQLDISLMPRPQVYNRFYFSGNQLLNTSLDYAVRLGNLRFFGETARSSNNAYATLNGLLIGLDRNMDLSIVQRAFDRDFQTLRGNPLAETAGVRNEQGLYLGTEIRLSKTWRLNAYMDLFKHPWLRFNIDAPTTGYEWLGRITYYQKRKLEIYAQVRNEVKYRNAVNNETKIDYTLPTQRLSTRLQFSYILSKAVELRSRLSVNSYNDGLLEQPEFGYLLYQDIIYKPLGPLSFTARYAVFRTDSFNARLYAYENDLLYSFSIPAYFNTGTRFYLNLRYKGIRNLTLEARFAQSYFQDGNLLSEKGATTPTMPNIIGSGLDEIEGNTRTELKFQLKYKF
ncbi:MAG: helix-hairpin-helix domain-containing protein, partial [Phaeodactylibacter sp.]|nr:helix-hairpin-helix domain-containing protein [Phaeodactylibacter sp.]